MPFPRSARCSPSSWKKIGIHLVSTENERSLTEKKRDGNENQIELWANDGSELLYAYPNHALPDRPGPSDGAGDRQVVPPRNGPRA